MVIEDEIVRFKMQLLRKMPFYGDIVMRLPIVRNDAVSTARTNGRMIEYGKVFEVFFVMEHSTVVTPVVKFKIHILVNKAERMKYAVENLFRRLLSI